MILVVFIEVLFNKGTSTCQIQHPQVFPGRKITRTKFWALKKLDFLLIKALKCQFFNKKDKSFLNRTLQVFFFHFWCFLRLCFALDIINQQFFLIGDQNNQRCNHSTPDPHSVLSLSTTFSEANPALTFIFRRAEHSETWSHKITV